VAASGVISRADVVIMAVRRPDCKAPRPGRDRVFELAERFGDRSRGVVADLVAIPAAVGLDEVEY